MPSAGSNSATTHHEVGSRLARDVTHITGRNTMNRRSVVTICAMSALGLLMLVGESSAQQKTLKEQLVGVWTVVSIENTAPNGSKRLIYSANPKGQYIFDAGG